MRGRFIALPSWAAVVVGVLAVAIGLFLAARPLTSLTALAVVIAIAALLTGLAELAASRRGLGTAFAVAWMLLGVFVLTELHVSISLIAPTVAIALLVSGVLRLLRALRGSVDERVVAALFGVAEVVFGVLAFLWPDVTLLLVGVLFGIRTTMFGVATVWDGIVRLCGTTVEQAPAARAPVRGFLRVSAAVVTFALAVSVAGISSSLRSESPTVDAFYTAPAGVPPEPGRLLRAEPFTRDMPGDAHAWRILYTTTRDAGEPALASGIVLVAKDAPPGPRPVIAWAHGTTGIAENCAPSVLDHPLAAGALPALEQIVARGWALVATDYVGLGTAGPHPYLIGQGEARSVLDAVRAARQLDTVDLSDQTVVWGHSQGGHAALWTGILAPTYAPDAGVVGVAALAPASDLIGLTANLPNVTGGSVFAAYVVAAYTDIYANVAFDAYIAPAAATIVRQMSARCLAEPGIVVSVLSALSLGRDRPIYRADPTAGAFGERLRENIPTGAMTVPVLLAQGATDTLVTPQVQSGYAQQRCTAGWNVDYRTYAGRDHIGVVERDSPLVPDLLSWTDARLRGEPQRPRCPQR